MSPTQSPPENRVIFFDNFRYLLVLCVVLQHSSNAYNNLIWWPVADGNTSIIVEWLSALIDAFAMPLLFYIAGYFALPTIQRKGVASFLNGKLRRLGIPWLICILTICPVLPLIYHYTRNDLILSTSYWDLWVVLMKNAAEFNVGIIYSMNELMQNDQFYQRYMWFLSLLLLFFFIFSIIYKLKRSWFEPDDQPGISGDPSIGSTLKFLVTVGFLTFLCSFIMIGIMFLLTPNLTNPEPLFTLGNVIQFRPSRLFFFIIYFGMGIITYRNKWIERGKFPGHFMTWVISFMILLIVYLYARHLMLHGPDHLEKVFGAIFFFILNFLTISTLGFFTAFAVRYWNRPTAVNQSLASNSYYMYLGHYLFVLVLQLLLFSFPGIPGLLKFGIVAGSSILCTYLVCEFLIRPFPRISVAMVSTMFIIMAWVIHP
jgi:hypothetical protein